MKIDPASLKPIYLQISEGIEDDILNGIIGEDEQAYSQYQISKRFNINPATAAKGINVLVSEGILYKRRGMGMHVSPGARESIRKKRKESFMNDYLKELVQEAEKLGIAKEELVEMIQEYPDKGVDEK